MMKIKIRNIPTRKELLAEKNLNIEEKPKMAVKHSKKLKARVKKKENVTNEGQRYVEYHVCIYIYSLVWPDAFFSLSLGREKKELGLV